MTIVTIALSLSGESATSLIGCPISGGDMKQGLYRFIDPEYGECVHMHSLMGDAYPSVPRDVYEAAGFVPAYTDLPTADDYGSRHPRKASSVQWIRFAA